MPSRETGTAAEPVSRLCKQCRQANVIRTTKGTALVQLKQCVYCTIFICQHFAPANQPNTKCSRCIFDDRERDLIGED